MWFKIVAIISGQIETLKTLKRVLSDNGIQRFKSIAEINDFNNKKNEELKIQKTSLKKEEETLINQKNIINSDEFDKRYTELKKKINEYNIKNKEI